MNHWVPWPCWGREVGARTENGLEKRQKLDEEKTRKNLRKIKLSSKKKKLSKILLNALYVLLRKVFEMNFYTRLLIGECSQSSL